MLDTNYTVMRSKDPSINSNKEWFIVFNVQLQRNTN